MGIATPVAAGEGTFMGKKGRSWWKEPGRMAIVWKARIIRAETVGGVRWVGQGGAGSLDKKWNAREIGEGAGEWVQRKPRKQAWVGLGGMSRKALGREGWRRKDEKDPSRPWISSADRTWVRECPDGQMSTDARSIFSLWLENKEPILWTRRHTFEFIQLTPCEDVTISVYSWGTWGSEK